MRNLYQQIGTTDNLLSMFETQSRDDIFHCIPQTLEHTDQCLSGLLEIARDKMFESHRLRLVCGFNLCGDARVTGSKLTVTTNRTANCHHWKSPKADSIRTETHQLDRVSRGTYAAIRPDFDSSAQPRF